MGRRIELAQPQSAARRRRDISRNDVTSPIRFAVSRKLFQRIGFVAFLASLLLVSRPAQGYVEQAYPLGKILADSNTVLLMTVEKVDKQKNTIVYRKVRDLKGTHPGETIKHSIGQAGFHPREWQTIMAWAEVGKSAVFFHNGGAGETCIDNYWYQSYAGDWWSMSHAEPFFLRSFAGKPDKLAAAVTAMLAGQEVVVPCMVDGDKNALHLRTGKLQRMKAGLKIQDYNLKRDFVDWGAGADEFLPVAGMPGFTHMLAMNRLGPGAAGIAPADINGDGKLDFCMFGTSRLFVLQNTGGSFDEIRVLPDGGARGAAWADFDGDGKPDLLAATPAGPRLFRNNGKQFDDVTLGLPQSSYSNPTAAAWIDCDGNGRPDILLADGFRGLRLYRNLGVQPGPSGPPVQPKLGRWYFAGPFDNTRRRGVVTAYPPEREINLAAQYVGKGNEKVTWREGNFNEGQVQGLRLFKPEHGANFVVYLYREVDCGGAAELPVSLGSDDCLAVWLNGVKLYEESVYHPCAPDQVPLNLKLRPGKNTLLLKICQGDGDCTFFFSPKPTTAAAVPSLFEDVSDVMGLGAAGIGSGLTGDRLVVADINADSRPDFLFSAGTGVVAINTPQRFLEMKDSGIVLRPGGITPVFGDFNGDGRPDLFVPQRGGSKLFRNDGGRFADVTAQAGDVARPLGDARCAVWADFGKPSQPDLVVGCWKGPNRYLRNNGNGTFTEVTEDIGLMDRIFNTNGLVACDINNDKVLDLAFNNEGQEALVLLTSATWPAARETRKVAAIVPPLAGQPEEMVQLAQAPAASPTQPAPAVEPSKTPEVMAEKPSVKPAPAKIVEQGTPSKPPVDAASPKQLAMDAMAALPQKPAVRVVRTRPPWALAPPPPITSNETAGRETDDRVESAAVNWQGPWQSLRWSVISSISAGAVLIVIAFEAARRRARARSEQLE